MQPDDGRLYTVMLAPPAVIVARMFAVLFPDARTALDMTYGSGRFWRDPPLVAVTRVDIDPDRAPDGAADFTALPYPDASFDVAVFDPPYHTDMGRGKASIMGGRFGTFSNVAVLKVAVLRGSREARRVSRLGALVKVQDHIHGRRLIMMSDWVRAELGAPYDLVHGVKSNGKLLSPRWTRQLSAWRNHATYYAFRWDREEHKPW
jgi:hypothetical protein